MSEPTVQIGTVQSYENCPRCSSEGSIVMETYVSGEQAGSCGRCGYSVSRRVVRNKEGEPLIDLSGKFTYTIDEFKEPFGAVHIVDKQNNANMYTVNTQEDFDKSVAPYIEQYRDLIESATLSKFVDGKIETTPI